MKLHSLTVRGIGRFAESQTFDASELEGSEVVAIRGPNGAGKTTMVECIPGVLWGEMPSRGPLARMAHGADAMVELVIETDQRYTLRRLINTTRKSPKQEAYIFDATGEPLNDGKVGTFDAEIDRRFPSQRVYMASGFAAQRGTGQFLQAPRAERRALFAEMLGLAHLQDLSTLFGERATEATSRHVALRSKLETLNERGCDIEALEARVFDLDRVLTNARDERVRAEALEAETIEAREEWMAAGVAVRGRCAAANEALATLTAEFRSLVDRRLRADVQTSEDTERRDAMTKRIEGRDAIELQARGAGGLADEIKAVETRVDELEKSRGEHAGLVVSYARAVDAVDAELRNLRASEKTAEGLTDVPCGGKDEFSACPLILGAIQAKRSVEPLRESAATLARDIPPAPAHAPRDVDGLVDRLRGLRSKHRDAEVAASRLKDLDRASVELDDLNQALGRRLREQSDIRDKCAAVKSDGEAARKIQQGADEALAAHDVNEPARLQGGLQGLRDIERVRSSDLDGALVRLEDAKKTAADVKTVDRELADASANLDDWRHLQQAFGRDGIQALEVDSAGPEVSDLINELLHSCYGSRFTCRLETARLKADGKGTKEVFDLSVIDTQFGTEGSAGDLSGGERVLVSEALGLAIAILNARRSDIPILDLWRDECAGALDVERAPLYIEMLRRAVRIGGFHRVYFIAHQPDLWVLADARIDVVDGTVSVS